MDRRDIRVLLAACLLALLAATAQSVVGLDTGLLFLAPAIVVALPLLAGRYPGARRLARMRGGNRGGRTAPRHPGRYPGGSGCCLEGGASSLRRWP